MNPDNEGSVTMFTLTDIIASEKLSESYHQSLTDIIASEKLSENYHQNHTSSGSRISLHFFIKAVCLP